MFIRLRCLIINDPVFKSYVLFCGYCPAFSWNCTCILLFILLQSALSNLEEMKAGRSDSPMVYRERVVRSVGVGPMRSRPNEKRIDTSPYSSGAYLSPPPDTSWRRTNSDSALHQSAMNIGGETSLHNSGSQRRGKLFYELWTIHCSWVVTIPALYLTGSGSDLSLKNGYPDKFYHPCPIIWCNVLWTSDIIIKRNINKFSKQL